MRPVVVSNFRPFPDSHGGLLRSWADRTGTVARRFTCNGGDMDAVGDRGRRYWTKAKIVLGAVGLCFILWVVLAESRLLPRFLTHEVEAYFEWESSRGFTTFRIQSYQNAEGNTWRGRAWQYLVAVQIEPRLMRYFKNSRWQRINGRVDVRVAGAIPVAIPIALGSGGDVIFDPDETPLMHAADRGNTEGVQHLLASALDINARDQKGETALIHACLRGNADPQLIRSLLLAGADVNAKDRNGRTPLMLAVQTPIVNRSRVQRFKAVAELLAAHPDVNAQDTRGDTALMMAAAYADTETVSVLMSAGADPNARNERGETALSFAEAKDNAEVVTLLRKVALMPPSS
jgi:hypothetical protein